MVEATRSIEISGIIFPHLSNWLARNVYQIWVVLESLSISCMVLLIKMGYHLTPWVASKKNRSFLGLNDITDAAIRFLPPWVGCFESCTTGRKNPMKHWMSLAFPWWKDGNKHVFMHFHFRMAAHEFFHCQLHFLSTCLESLLVLCFAFLLPPFFFGKRRSDCQKVLSKNGRSYSDLGLGFIWIKHVVFCNFIGIHS